MSSEGTKNTQICDVSDHSTLNHTESESHQLTEDVPIMQLIMNLQDINEDDILQQKGYQKVEKICNTLQGELYKAMRINPLDNEIKYVCIKKTHKDLFQKHIAVQDDNNFIVSENIIKESLILRHATVDNTPIGNYIAKYIDFFESCDSYYLVIEHISSEMNLKQFVYKCNAYIENGQLTLKQYHKMVKYLLFQLFVTVVWLHTKLQCAHLDLVSSNVMICDIKFIEDRNGKIKVISNPSIKLIDFGVAEIFDDMQTLQSRNNYFLCNKQGLDVDNEGWFAPNVFNEEMYDARCADIWSCGIILYECMTVGQKLYDPIEIYNENSAYSAIYKGRLQEYLMTNSNIKYFDKQCFSLLNGLLNVNEQERINGIDILKHPWFKAYYKRYQKQIKKKFSKNRQSIIGIDGYREPFPFYNSHYI